MGKEYLFERIFVIFPLKSQGWQEAREKRRGCEGENRSTDVANKGQIHRVMNSVFPNMAYSVLFERDTPSVYRSSLLKVSLSCCNNIVSSFQTFSKLQCAFQWPISLSTGGVSKVTCLKLNFWSSLKSSPLNVLLNPGNDNSVLLDTWARNLVAILKSSLFTPYIQFSLDLVNAYPHSWGTLSPWLPCSSLTMDALLFAYLFVKIPRVALVNYLFAKQMFSCLHCIMSKLASSW